VPPIPLLSSPLKGEGPDGEDRRSSEYKKGLTVIG
jgi:hypothetical protein